MKKFFKRLLLLLIALISLSLIKPATISQADNANKEIAFADAGWDSIKFHNAVAGLIAQELTVILGGRFQAQVLYCMKAY